MVPAVGESLHFKIDFDAAAPAAAAAAAAAATRAGARARRESFRLGLLLAIGLLEHRSVSYARVPYATALYLRYVGHHIHVPCQVCMRLQGIERARLLRASRC